MGYLNMAEKTEESLDTEGWLHSGDLGKHNEKGNLFITGRIKGNNTNSSKLEADESCPYYYYFNIIILILLYCSIPELIITAGGENIPPVPIEDSVKEALPLISNAMLIGDRKKFLAMLLTLKVHTHTHTHTLPRHTPHTYTPSQTPNTH